MPLSLSIKQLLFGGRMETNTKLLYAIQISSENPEYRVQTAFNNAWLEPLAKVNIFVGENNAGKSRFLRSLFATMPVIALKKEMAIKAIVQDSRVLIHNISTLMSNAKISNYDKVHEFCEALADVINSEDKKHHSARITELLHIARGLSEKCEKKDAFGEVQFRDEANKHFFNPTTFNQELKKLLSTFLTKIMKVFETHEINTYKHIYIPTLRGLREISTNDTYQTRTLDDYFGKLKSSTYQHSGMHLVFTGLDLYNEVRKLLLGNLQNRNKIAEFQTFLGESFFEGKLITLLPHIDSKVLYVKIGDEAEQPIYKLGDGLQSIIIMTFQLFLHKDEFILLFIEEPEIYLHPALQRKLIEIFLLPEFAKAQIFFTTHSNHFLDLTLDMNNISVFTFKKDFSNSSIAGEKSLPQEIEPNFVIENVNNEDSQALELLGVNISSVLLSNCTIWVEGITDRFYIRHMLNTYIQHMKLNSYLEDLHYSFVEYSGNNITHWSFLENPQIQNGFRTINVDRLCGKLMLITDRDSDKKIPRHEKLQERLGERFICLPCREIENILHPEVITRVVEQYEKTEQVKFKKLLNEKDYRDNLLGNYLDEIISSPKHKYASESGTISDKVNFAKKAISHIHSLDDMTQDSIDMCKRIYDFIKKCNTC
jgi:AAA15 family ATPase/GTPase